MESAYEKKLRTQKMLPLIFTMALPAVAAQIVNLLYNIVDRIYIGHIPEIGTQALAGVGVTSSVIILVAAFAQIVGSGGAPLASMALGREDREEAGKFLGNGLFLLILFSFVTTVPVYIFMEPLLSAVGASENTLGYACEYLNVYLLGTFFVMVSVGLNTFINAQGRPGIAMVSVIIGASLNIVLDPVFMFALGMGVKGAAVATVISQLVSCIWVLAFLVSKKASLRLELKFMRPDADIIKRMFALGVSPFIMASTESLVGFVLNGILKGFSDIYVSALTVMQSAMQVVNVPLTGFAQGFVPVISYNYGAGDRRRVKQGFKISVSFMFAFNFLIVGLMMLFPSLSAQIFTDDASLIETVAEYMPLFFAGMTIFGLQRACQNMFVALGRAKVSLFIAFLRKLFLLIPLALILSRLMGVKGVFTAEAIADATAAIICTAIFAHTFPKILNNMKKIGD